MLDRVRDAERVAAALSSGRAGVVRLATASGAADVVHALLAHHRAAHPGVHVELHHVRRAPTLRALLDGEIDAALVHTAPRTAFLAFTEVSSEPWRGVASSEHPLAGGQAISLRALAGYPTVLVAGEGTDRLRERFEALCRGAGFEPMLGRTLPDLNDTVVEIARSPGRCCSRPTCPTSGASASLTSR